MNIQLRFFASVREALGTAQERLNVPDSVTSLGDVRTLLQQRGGVWAETLADHKSLRMACNQHMSNADAALSEGCEVAFFPPVTGG